MISDIENEADIPSLTASICTAMMRVGTRMAAVFDQKFAEMGITQAQFRTLLAICDVGGDEGIAPSDLATYLLLDRATVTILTSRLVEEGYIERLPGVNRRTFRLRVTPTGMERVYMVAPVATRFADFTLEEFSAEEQGTFWMLLQKLERRVRSIDPKTPLYSNAPELEKEEANE